MLPIPLVQRILQRFPKNLSYCFAYGSGVKKQTGYNEKAQQNAMIDLILCVDDAHAFHEENLARNPHDYSFMRYFGTSLISNYQNFSAGVYFNTLVPIDNNCTIKYGVIRTNALCDDLSHWTHLYVAGRLQKPVETLIPPTNPKIIESLDDNLDSALRLALMLLPERFSYFELFHEIANISYFGDFRMIFGESKKKVKNIVEPQMDAFLHLYAPYMKKMSHCLKVPDYINVNEQQLMQSKEPEVFAEHWERMPANICDAINQDIDKSAIDMAKLAHKSGPVLKSAIFKINSSNSFIQSVKNIPTAGLIKAIRYSARKATKTFS